VKRGTLCLFFFQQEGGKQNEKKEKKKRTEKSFSPKDTVNNRKDGTVHLRRESHFTEEVTIWRKGREDSSIHFYTIQGQQIKQADQKY